MCQAKCCNLLANSSKHIKQISNKVDAPEASDHDGRVLVKVRPRRLLSQRPDTVVEHEDNAIRLEILIEFREQCFITNKSAMGQFTKYIKKKLVVCTDQLRLSRSRHEQQEQQRCQSDPRVVSWIEHSTRIQLNKPGSPH